MKTLIELAAVLLPILFILLCLRMSIASIGPVILPLVALAFIGIVVWLWLHSRKR
jgi:hypothetical protein